MYLSAVSTTTYATCESLRIKNVSRHSIPAADEALALEVRNTAHELMTGIVSYFHEEKEPVNEIIFVPTTIMSRILRASW